MQKYPTLLYNGMVAPMTSFPIKGVIWYQGESNEDNSQVYAALMQTLIHAWRSAWGKDFPFYEVQLAAFRDPMSIQPDSRWAKIREAQQETAKVDGVGTISAIDIGEAADIHPKNKQEVGRRLATLALADCYGIGDCHYPHYLDYAIRGNEVIIALASP